MSERARATFQWTPDDKAKLRSEWFDRDPGVEDAAEFDARMGRHFNAYPSLITYKREAMGLCDYSPHRPGFVDTMVERIEAYWARREAEDPGCRSRHEQPQRHGPVRYVERVDFRRPDSSYGTLAGVADYGGGKPRGGGWA